MEDKTYNIALREELAQENEEMMFAEGYDHCIIGTAGGKAVYDTNAIIATLMEDGCTEEEAWEHFEYNIEGSYVGDYTPIYMKELLKESETTIVLAPSDAEAFIPLVGILPKGEATAVPLTLPAEGSQRRELKIGERVAVIKGKYKGETGIIAELIDPDKLRPEGAVRLSPKGPLIKRGKVALVASRRDVEEEWKQDPYLTTRQLFPEQIADDLPLLTQFRFKRCLTCYTDASLRSKTRILCDGKLSITVLYILCPYCGKYEYVNVLVRSDLPYPNAFQAEALIVGKSEMEAVIPV